MQIQIKCPNCGSRVCDANSRVFVRTKISGVKQAVMDYTADYFIKCWKCKTTICITKN